MTDLTRRDTLRTVGLATLGLASLAGCTGSSGGGDGDGGSGSDGSSGSGDTATPAGTPTDSEGSGSSDSDGSGGSDSDGSGSSGSGDTADEVSEYLSDVGNFSGVVDETGSDSVTVTVGAEGNGGNLAFAPPAVRVSAGTAVTWEWNGKGGSHNVVAEDGSFESELTTEAGHTFSHTFEESGVYTYYCQPHKALEMKGAVVVE
jgi:halocyanin-like protein